ncbi:AMP-binding protein [Cobetia sp. L2A1]|uniref:AMP-binding protein n=1 Tax=Cobetia sp. L2A1 TaxID=2686360 RepID=UPI00131AC6F4|nr:AMP-binding protein [Cobetia sp. L2A1]
MSSLPHTPDDSRHTAMLSSLSWRRHARQAPDATACWLATPGQPLTALSRADLMARIAAWQQWLDHQPASRPGARWVLFQTTTLGACVQLLALWERGMLAVLPGDDRPETLARLRETSVGQLPATTVDGWPSQTHAVAQSTARLTGQQTAPEQRISRQLALALCTSGSTGEPLQITKRFDQLEAELAVHQQLWPLTSGKGDSPDTIVSLSQVSHQHIYGLLTALLRPLCAGVPFLSEACHYPEQLSAAISQLASQGYRCQVISSPAQLARLPQTATAETGQVLRIFSSGAPLPEAAARHAEANLHAPVIEIYGSTETGGIAQRRQRDGVEWSPLPCVELRFSGENQEDISSQEVPMPASSLWLRSPFLNTPSEWWPQADRAEICEHRHHDGQPRFRLLGRSDRLVKLAGKRISLSAVERCLNEQAEVLDVRCLPMPTREHRLGAVIVMAPDALPHDHNTRRALIAHLRRALMPGFERIALPRYWRFVTRLPLNAQGKFTSEAIARLFADLDDHRLPRWLGEHSSGPEQLTLEAEVPDSLIYLDGHFAQQPLVPGVVMLKWARDLGKRLQLNGQQIDDAHFMRLERIKFSSLLLPGMRFTLDGTLVRDGHGLRVDFRLASGAGLHASGRLRYAVSDPSRLSESSSAQPPLAPQPSAHSPEAS